MHRLGLVYRVCCEHLFNYVVKLVACNQLVVGAFNTQHQRKVQIRAPPNLAPESWLSSTPLSTNWDPGARQLQLRLVATLGPSEGLMVDEASALEDPEKLKEHALKNLIKKKNSFWLCLAACGILVPWPE